MEVLLLHRPDPLWEGEKIAEAFQKLGLSGKVRYFGVSNQNRFQMEIIAYGTDRYRLEAYATLRRRAS